MMNSTTRHDVTDTIGSGAAQVCNVSSMEQEPNVENTCFAGGGSKTVFDLSRETGLFTSQDGHGRRGEHEPQSAELLDISHVNDTTLTYNQANRFAGNLSFIEGFNYYDGAEYHEKMDTAMQGNPHDSEDSNYRSFIQNHDNGAGECQKMNGQHENKSKDFCFKRPCHLQYPWRQVRRRRKFRLLCMAVFYVISISCASLYRRVANRTGPSDQVTGEKHRGSSGHRAIREASVATNGTKCPEHNRGVMPPDFLSEEVAKNGGWLVHLFIGSYMFAAVASVCDIYFVPSLEHISEDLDLQADVAGATFMAAASSAPEFCTSVITTLIAKSDAGLGAIVGSSIFNLLVIVGACAIFAGMPVQLTWYPLTRDTIFYTLSVILMAVFMYDNVILWYEATLMIVTYLLYILVMFFNKRLERWSILKLKSCRRQTLVNIMEEEESANNRLAMMDARRHSRICSQDTLTRSGIREIERLTVANIGEPKEILAKASRVTISETLVRKISSLYNKVETMQTQGLSPVNVEIGTSIDPVPNVSPDVKVATPVEDEVEKDEKAVGVSEYTNPLAFPKGFLSRCYYIFILPATLLHAFTIPDSRILGTWQSKLYLVSFILSVVYIGAYSYVMVWMITMAGNVWGIPETITGLTVLAAGTSVPDLLSSVFVARDGYGDMAVSNAIGSNVFDILLCLGIPWLIDNLSISKNGTVIDSEGMLFAVLTLFITIAYLWGSMKCFNWTLTPVYGFVTISVYLVIMTFCILIETNVLFRFHAPSPCKP